jgi:hypothetical protein
MKVSRQMKIISSIGIVAIAIVAIACANLNNNSIVTSVNITTQSIAKWQRKAPQLFSNVGYSKLIESCTLLNKNMSESQAELLGIITNPFGIRDDILNYILTNIPESNTRTRIAAIKMSYYDQQMIGVVDDKVINQLENKAGAGLYCMQLPMLEENKLIKGYDKLLRNTPERLNEQNRIEHLLNGHIISYDFGIDTYDFKLQCNHYLGV